jgi:hypothetical protein
MRHVNGVYAQAFNQRHGLLGHLSQGRFKAILVDPDAYLLALCRYVERNSEGLFAYLLGRPVQSPRDREWATRRYAALVDETGTDEPSTWQNPPAPAATWVSRMQAMASGAQLSSLSGGFATCPITLEA